MTIAADHINQAFQKVQSLQIQPTDYNVAKIYHILALMKNAYAEAEAMGAEIQDLKTKLGALAPADPDQKDLPEDKTTEPEEEMEI